MEIKITSSKKRVGRPRKNQEQLDSINTQISQYKKIN